MRDGEAIRRLVDLWERSIRGFLDGGGSVLPELKRWSESYSGAGQGKVDLDAMPEPYLGPLKPGAKAVFLALNPGQPFPFQRRDGHFAERVRDLRSYRAWVATWPYIDGDWERQKETPNRHHQSRLEFMRRWFADRDLGAESMVSFELYPWHSRRVTAVMRPDRDDIQRYIWEPIADLSPRAIFAFGAPWFRLLETELGLEVVARLGRDGDPYASSVPSRSVLVMRTAAGTPVIAEKHSGSAGPPSKEETKRLRSAVERFL